MQLCSFFNLHLHPGGFVNKMIKIFFLCFDGKIAFLRFWRKIRFYRFGGKYFFAVFAEKIHFAVLAENVCLTKKCVLRV